MISKNKKISHLTDSEVEELIEMYYSGESLSNIKTKFSLQGNITNLPLLFPLKTVNKICIYCNQPMKGRYPSRSKNISELENIHCINCKHIDEVHCTCVNCTKNREIDRQNRLREKKDQIRLIISHFIQESEDLLYLNIKQRCVVGALLRDGSTEELSMILPLESGYYKLSPNPNYDSQLINFVSKDSNCVVISPDSNTESIVDIDLEKGSFRYSPKKVSWLININSSELTKNEILDQLINPTLITDRELNDAFDLWTEVAMYECLEYLNYTTESCFKVSYQIGEKTELTIKDLLKTLSVSQIYGVIYKATNEALRFYAEKKVTKQHAINTIIGACRSYAERAQSNGWILQKYHRIKDLPQSSISKFLYERLLRIGDKGFYDTPSVNLISYIASPKIDSNPSEDNLPF